MVHYENGIQFRYEKEQTNDTYNNMNEFQMHCTKSNSYLSYDYIYMGFWKKQKYRDR